MNAESIKKIGGLVALVSGLIVLALIAGGALAVNSTAAEKIALGAFSVIGTLVGAYFGQKVGSDGTKEAAKKATQEGIKAQVYAAHLPPAAAPAIIRLAQEVASGNEPPPAVADAGGAGGGAGGAAGGGDGGGGGGGGG